MLTLLELLLCRAKLPLTGPGASSQATQDSANPPSQVQQSLKDKTVFLTQTGTHSPHLVLA